jgi:uncharacterized protein (TIGR03435 family)
LKTLCLYLSLAATIGAQSRPKFEVVSVKECRQGEVAPPSSSSPARLSLGCRALGVLIQEAYDSFASGEPSSSRPRVRPMDLEGAPGWLGSARYSIDAKTETPQSGAMMRGPMMQLLLEERFRLAIHRATREEDVYIMTVAKGGLKAPHTKEGSCIPYDYSEALSMRPGEVDETKLCGAPARPSTHGSRAVFDVKGWSFSILAKMLRPDGRFVIDETGVEGLYDLHFEWDPPNAPAPDPGTAADPSPHATEIEAMQTQLGIRLTPGKGPREYLVIDHIERPAAN